MVQIDGRAAGESLVRARGLGKTYQRGGEQIHVLQGLNLDVDAGEFIAFMGPSGSGKTTLLNLLGGLDVPSAGSVTVAGDEITRMSARKLTSWRSRHVGFVFQMYNLIPVLTAFQNVELPLLLTSLSKAQRRQHVETALDVVGLSDRMHHYPRQLSGGQEQRVGIARAIVADPTFLLCDEPTGDLDRKSADEALDLIDRLVREFGKTVLMVTHDPLAAERAHVVLHLQKGVHVAGVDRLVVLNRVSIIQPLPLAYRDRLLRIPGVTHVTFANWFGGVYQDERNFFPQFAVDRETYRQMFTEFIVPDDQWQGFQTDKEGAIVGEALAERFKWKIGDRIPIKGTIFAGTWEFNIRGIYRGRRVQDDTTQLWFRWDYLDERKAFGKGWVGWYTVRIANPDDAVRLVKVIDEQFANSPAENTTDTEMAFAASFVKQMGNIQLLIMSVGSVVFFTLLLVTGNTMAIAVRERTRELAVLKAVGFSDVFVLALVIAETLVVAAVGGGVGLGLAKLFTLRGDPTGGLLPFFHLPGSSIVSGLALALAVGLTAGILPALSASRLRVVDALRRI